MTDDVADRLRAEVGALTRGPASGFVAARTERVRALKAAGERELAAALGGCRRPTLPAWAADQLAHHHADELEQLFVAAEELRVAQAAGRDGPGDQRAARDAFTGTVRRLRGLAAERLRDTGSSPDGHLDEVEATLLAAAVDPEVAADLRAGALTVPAPSPGFAALASITPAAPAPRPADAADAPDAAEADPPTAELGSGATEADDAAAEAAAAARRRAELAERRDELEATRRTLADAVERHDREAADAEAEAAELRRRADEAAHAATDRRDRHRRGTAELGELDRELGELDRELTQLDRQLAALPEDPATER